MPLISYRGSGSGARLIFGVSTREFLRLHTYGEGNKNPIYGSIIVITSIILVTVFLLLAPKSVQPIASYIAFSLLLLLPLIFMLFILFNQLKRKFLSPPPADANPEAVAAGDPVPDGEISRRHSSNATSVHSTNDHKLSISSTPSTVYAVPISGHKSPSF